MNIQRRTRNIQHPTVGTLHLVIGHFLLAIGHSTAGRAAVLSALSYLRTIKENASFTITYSPTTATSVGSPGVSNDATSNG